MFTIETMLIRKISLVSNCNFTSNHKAIRVKTTNLGITSGALLVASFAKQNKSTLKRSFQYFWKKVQAKLNVL